MKNISIITTLFLYSLLTFGQNKTPDYWKCDNRSGGSWNFGRAPSVCDVDPFVSKDYVENVFSPLIFLDSSDENQERRRYMQEVYGVIVDASKFFIEMRNPEVSSEETQEFTKAILAVAHQESYWSHYRVPSNQRFQYMRGDYGHGHGIFQVDDRWHYVAINEAKGANFILNMFYSLDEFYDAWKRAPGVSCVKSEDDWVARSRSAYSVYNGGASKICRWTNSKDKWARNDQGFISKYEQRSWESYVDDLNYEGYLNIECAFNENENCEKGDQQQIARESVSYTHLDYGNCFYKEAEETFYCANQNEICLASKVYGKVTTKFKRSKISEDWDSYNFVDIGGEDLCSDLKGLYPVLSTIKVLKNINIRKTPGGERIDTFKSGESSIVLDFSFSSTTSTLERYYKIEYKNITGYIYAGDINDYLEWAELTDLKPTYSSVARVGEFVTAQEPMNSVDKNYNINDTDRFEVMGRFAKENSLFYQLNVNGENVDFYAGNLLNADVLEFFKLNPIKEKDDNEVVLRTGELSSRIWWKKIVSCASVKCGNVATIKGPRLSSKKFEILKEENGWMLVRQYGSEGWVKSKYVKVL